MKELTRSPLVRGLPLPWRNNGNVINGTRVVQLHRRREDLPAQVVDFSGPCRISRILGSTDPPLLDAEGVGEIDDRRESSPYQVVI